MYIAEHEAMATRFVLEVECADETVANAFFSEAFRLVDELELILSRFIPDSDISRINALAEGKHVMIEHESWELLKKAIEVMAWTAGAFDIGVGKYMDVFRAGKQGLLNEKEVLQAQQKLYHEKQKAAIYIDPDEPRAYKVKEGMHLDLGGIGKGFVLEKISNHLSECGAKAFKLNAGDSTLLMKSDTGQQWPFSLVAAQSEQQVELSNTSISASGTYWQGQHIFDPRTGTNTFQALYDRVWVCADDASYSDALSTAFFMMPEPEICEVLQNIPGLRWVACSKKGKIEMFRPHC